MKMVKFTVILAVLSIVLTAMAQDDRPGPRGRGGFDGPARGPYAPMQDRPFDGPGGRMQRPGQPGQQPGMGGINIERYIQMLTRELNLTDEQKEAVTKLLEERREAVEANRKIMRETSEELRKAVMEGDPDAAAKYAKTLADAMTEQAVAQAKTVKAVNDLLTEEQKTQLEALKEKMRQRIENARQGQGEEQLAPPPGDDEEPMPRPRRQRRPLPEPEPGLD